MTRALEQEQRDEAEAEEDAPLVEEIDDPLDGLDAERILARAQGGAGWVLEAQRQLDQERWQKAGPIPRCRSERLRIAARQFEENLAAELRGNRAYEASREQRRGTRRHGSPPNPYMPREIPQKEVNVTDPDSRRMKQTQPQVRPLQLPRQTGSAYRVAISDDESQPDRALPSPDRRPGGLKRRLRGHSDLNWALTSAAHATVRVGRRSTALRNSYRG